MGARQYKQYTCLGEDEDRGEDKRRTDILFLLVFRHYSRYDRRDVEMAAAKEPDRTGCEYGDNAMDAAATEEGPSINA